MAKKIETRRRFRNPRRDPGRYHQIILDNRARERLGLEPGEEPEFDEVEVVETWAIQGGEKVKIRVWADTVSDYEEIVAEWEVAQEEAGS